MAGQRITLSDTFETLIARAGLAKEQLAREAGITRPVIFRAINPAAYAGVGGTLRETTAWSIARVYAVRTGVELESAFARLFVVTGQSAPERAVSQPLHAASACGSQPAQQELLDDLPKVPRQSRNIRLDEEAMSMLDALMQDEERSSQREMVRVLIKRAYRALLARQSSSESTVFKVPPTNNR